MSGSKKKMSVMSRLAIIQVVIMLLLTMLMSHMVTSSTNKSSSQHIETVCVERSNIIERYVENAEQILTSYSCAPEILDAVTHPDDKAKQDAVQAYTEKISATIDNLEGIYASEWNTHVLTHTNAGTIGITTRKDPDSLKQLQDAMSSAGDGVYNAGIIISPASGEQIISMYKAVYDSAGNPAGLVGLGIYTTGIIDDLDKLGISDLPNSFFSMVDVTNGKYIFHSDKAKVNTDIQSDKLKALCGELNGRTTDKTGTFTYKEGGKGLLSIYNYTGKRGWVFMIDDTHSEIYALSSRMIVFLLIFSCFFIGIAIIFNILGKKQEEITEKLDTTMKKNARTKESLNSAVFNDILTDAKNRISFTSDFESGKVKDAPDHPYYFIMFNICGFSNINIMYGEDIGDIILANAAATLRAVFEGASVYRTGSDEFVAVIQSAGGAAGNGKVTSLADQALSSLLHPQNTPAGNINLTYRASIVKKSRDINSSVLPAMKDVINQSGPAMPGQIAFLDLDNI